MSFESHILDHIPKKEVSTHPEFFFFFSGHFFIIFIILYYIILYYILYNI
jgi:hypothetical protein